MGPACASVRTPRIPTHGMLSLLHPTPTAVTPHYTPPRRSHPLSVAAALGNLMKSIFADTNLVVAGTVLTLALNLALEEGAGPRRFVDGVSGALYLLLPFQTPEGSDSSHLKEL